jgi:hypothetical protein
VSGGPCAWCGKPKDEHRGRSREDGGQGLCPGTSSSFYTPTVKPPPADPLRALAERIWPDLHRIDGREDWLRAAVAALAVQPGGCGAAGHVGSYSDEGTGCCPTCEVQARHGKPRAALDGFVERVVAGAEAAERARVVAWLQAPANVEDTLGWSSHAADLLTAGAHRHRAPVDKP